MNLDDQSLLSAYLDGELDPAARLRVEAALEEDPRLAERLGDLAAVRGFVRSLPRPTAGVDLAPAVIARIEAQPGWLPRLAQTFRSRTVRSRVLNAGAALATAAALLVALQAAFRPTAVPERAVVQPPVVPVAPEMPEPPAAETLVHNTPAPAPVLAPAPPEPRRIIPAPAPAEAAEDRDLLVRLLDRPEVRRVVVPVASLSPGELSRVEQVLAGAPRAEALQGELRIEPGLALEAGRRPGGSVLYLAWLSGAELNSLLGALRRELPGTAPAVEILPPEVVTQLCDAGSVRFSGPRPAADLLPPGDEVSGIFAHRDSDPSERPEAAADDPAAPPAASGARRLESVPESDPTTLYLVWVTPQAPDESDGQRAR